MDFDSNGSVQDHSNPPWRPSITWDGFLHGSCEEAIRSDFVGGHIDRPVECQSGQDDDATAGPSGQPLRDSINRSPCRLPTDDGIFTKSLRSERTNSERGLVGIRKPLNVLDMDSDDEIIWKMKNEGYKDRPVRDRLIAEGRTIYDHKTIATRYSRMRRMMREHEEIGLDNEFSDFHEDEDIQIEAAVQQAQSQYETDLLAASARRWSFVSDILAVKLGKRKYTKNTAQTRYESLKNGTAIPPLEHDPNPTVRTARCLHERQVRISRAREEQEREKKKRQTIGMLKKQKAREEADRRTQKRIETLKKKAMLDEKGRQRKAVQKEKRKVKWKQQETQAEKIVKRFVENELKKKAKEDIRAAKQWSKDQERATRQQQIQKERLEKVQALAEQKMAKLISMQEDNQRRELIRRCLRNAGIATAAPSLSGNGTMFDGILSFVEDVA